MKIIVIPVLLLAFLIAQRSVFANGADAIDGYTSAQCVECHEEMEADHAASAHRNIQCLDCHTQAVEEDHEQVAPVECRQCHTTHDEKVAHDAHLTVTCQACHLTGGSPVKIVETGRVNRQIIRRADRQSRVHQMVPSEDEQSCQRCHFSGNKIGAAAMVLPAKSILCMPCHVATFSVGDKTTLVSLFIFLVGMVGLGAVWFSGSIRRGVHRPGEKTEVKTRFGPGALFPGKFLQLLKTVFVEVVLLQRLFRLSPARWIIHALIFFPFLFRFTFGLTALLLSIFLPDGSITAAMLDKNNAMRALFFDITGLMILAGSAAAIVRHEKDPAEKITSLPEPGRGMPALIGLIVLVGFVLEGLRIAVTGWPDGAGWAFLGYGISLMLKGMTGLTDSYGYVWYAHAILTGVFLALIPFTRMSHIITAPIVLMANARSKVQELF